MAYRITQDPILSVAADAAVLCVEIKTIATQSPSSVQLAGTAGGAFRARLKKERFLPVGSAEAAGTGIGWANAGVGNDKVVREIRSPGAIAKDK